MTRDELISLVLSSSSPKPVPVQINGTGTLYVRVMTAFDADQMRKQLESNKKEDGCAVGRMLATVLCDADGALLFDVANDDDALKLSKLPNRMQTDIIDAANQVNGVAQGNA